MTGSERALLCTPTWPITAIADTLPHAAHGLVIWRIPCLPATQVDKALRHVTATEQQHYKAMRHVKAKQHFLAGRVALRCFFGQCLGIAPHKVVFSRGARGKPQLADGQIPWHFNVSHSGDDVLLAVTQLGQVGIDLECHDRQKRDPLAIARRYFHPNEADALALLPTQSQLQAFLRMWVIKEAMLKAVGQGVRDGLPCLELQTTWPHAIVAMHNQPTWTPARWFVQHLAVQPSGFATAVIVSPKSPCSGMYGYRWSWSQVL